MATIEVLVPFWCTHNKPYISLCFASIWRIMTLCFSYILCVRYEWPRKHHIYTRTLPSSIKTIFFFSLNIRGPSVDVFLAQ